MEGQDSGDCTDPTLQGVQEGEPATNRHLHDHLPSRHAKELFEDFLNRLLKLEWIPSSENHVMLRDCDEEVLFIRASSKVLASLTADLVL
jgi:hypothetical protein